MQLILLSLVTYRVTRFLIEDTLIIHQRIWVLNALLGRRPGKIRGKLHELLSCKFCMSIWVAAAAVGVMTQFQSVAVPVYVWLGASGGSMIVWKFAESSEIEVTNVIKHREAKYE